MKLLHLDASALGPQSVTRELTAAITQSLVHQESDVEVIHRDLVAQPLPHWEPVTGASREPDALGEQILSEFLEADVVVIGAPMYNFGIPSQLKAWIDRIAVPGQTFRYTENGPEGLASGKTVIVASARGGVYSQGPANVMDFQERYLQAMLGFLGITDVRFVRAEGIAMGGEQRQRAIADAHTSIRELGMEAVA